MTKIVPNQTVFRQWKNIDVIEETRAYCFGKETMKKEGKSWKRFHY
jgi:hypothetical protein